MNDTGFEKLSLSRLKTVKRKAIDVSPQSLLKSNIKATQPQNKKILLLLLPFWTPMIPPMGICNLKSYLESNGYSVRTADLNIEGGLRKFYQQYFEELNKYVPDDKKGNFYSIGHDVLRNHMMAYIHRENDKKYVDLVKVIIAKTYFIELENIKILNLDAIIDAYFKDLKSLIIELFEKEKPWILGLSVFKDTLPSSMFVFRFIRDKYPEVKNIMGGPIFSEQLVIGTPDYEFFLEKTKDYIDTIIIGQGEILFYKYLLGQLSEAQRVFTENDINHEVLDLPSFHVADYADIDLSNYLYLGATASSGCLYRCSFCNVQKFFGPFKTKNVKQTVDEMEQLYRTYNVPFFFMTDHMINPVADQLSEEIIRRDLNIYWTAYLRVDNSVCNPDKTAFWRKGGMYCARVGIESGSQNVLNYMGKRISPEQSKNSLISLAKSGIKTTVYFLVGHPGETEEDFQATLDFLEETKDYIWEAECDYFNYNYSGQSQSDKWANIRTLVYPKEARERLVCQKWSLDCYPFRDEIFERISRFSIHCKKLGIPNTYSFHDIYLADVRWKKLHNNAVPPLLNYRFS